MRRVAVLVGILGTLVTGCPAIAVAGALTISPQQGTPDASRQTQISLRGVAPEVIGSVVVTGSRTGAHAGRLAAYAAGQGASFLPDMPFAPGERVDVTVQIAGGSASSTTFAIARTPPSTGVPRPAAPRVSRHGAQAFASRPDLLPPRLVTSGRLTAGDGDVFLAPKVGPVAVRTQPGQSGAMILDSRARLVWWSPAPAGKALYDFRAQTLDGAPVLTWWEGTTNALGIGRGEDVVVDSTYRPIARLRAGNGYDADLHEFLIAPDGTVWITAYTRVPQDLRRIGGRARDAVEDSLIQQLDIKTGLVMYEWHALGHLRVADCWLKPARRLPYDPFHINSVQPLADGTILVSARNTSALYLIDKASGHVVWRLAGRRSTFRIADHAGFAWQHDARLLPGGRISIFDNEASPRVGPRPRGLVLQLDRRRGVVRAVAEYVHPGRVLAGSQGNMQQLPGGDMLVGWGAGGLVSEFTRSGRRRFDLRLPSPEETYRAFRAPWSGEPADRPALAAVARSPGTVDLAASWNGATGVERWQVLSGPTADALVPGTSARWSGLETVVRVRGGGPYYAVQAVAADGRVLATSDAVRRGGA